MATPQRPLSPHLQIYKRQITAVLSILHRATGVAAAFGALALTCWLLALAGNAADYARFSALLGSPVGQIVLFGVSASLIYHLLNGVRHLFWDIGWGFEIPAVYRSGYIVIALTLGLTGLLWYAGLVAGGIV